MTTLPKDIEEAIAELTKIYDFPATRGVIKRLRTAIALAVHGTQRQRYKEAIAGMAEREGIRLGLIDETLFANDCGRMADALCKEDAEHAKKEKL